MHRQEDVLTHGPPAVLKTGAADPTALRKTIPTALHSVFRIGSIAIAMVDAANMKVMKPVRGIVRET